MSFLRHFEVEAKKHCLKTVDILVELGKHRMVGGQEDTVVDSGARFVAPAQYGPRAQLTFGTARSDRFDPLERNEVGPAFFMVT